MRPSETEQAQRLICEANGAEFLATDLEDKAGVAVNVMPTSILINGLRHPPDNGTCGWFIWAGEELGSTVDFFRPLHVEHLIERCPAVLKYLGLAPGWRFLLAPDYEDVWLDASSLEVKKLDGWKAAELDKDKMTGLTATPFLMFQGNGREALDFYAATFPGATIEDLQLYGPGEPSPEGTVRSAVLIVGGQRLRIFDSPPVHAFSFTPAISFFLDCESEAQLRGLAAALLEGGAAMMPVGSYGFSTLFAWVADRFGVSWQLNLA